MKAKEFLLQIKKLDVMIRNKKVEKKQWESIALGIVPNYGGERVQSSGSQQKMADAMDKGVDIDLEIDGLIERKKEIISVIESLDVVEYDLLHKVYVQYLTLEQVAELYEKSYSWATTIHGKALKNVQIIIDSGIPVV